LVCTEYNLFNRNRDVSSSFGLLFLITSVYGNIGAENCTLGTNKTMKIGVPAFNENSCYYSHPNRRIETFDCSELPTFHDDENKDSSDFRRMCYCEKKNEKEGGLASLFYWMLAFFIASCVICIFSCFLWKRKVGYMSRQDMGLEMSQMVRVIDDLDSVSECEIDSMKCNTSTFLGAQYMNMDLKSIPHSTETVYIKKGQNVRFEDDVKKYDSLQNESSIYSLAKYFDMELNSVSSSMEKRYEQELCKDSSSLIPEKDCQIEIDASIGEGNFGQVHSHITACMLETPPAIRPLFFILF